MHPDWRVNDQDWKYSLLMCGYMSCLIFITLVVRSGYMTFAGGFAH